MGKVHHHTTLQDFNQDYNSDKKLVIQFTAAWCGPCKVISPKVEALAKDHKHIKFIKIDVDDKSLEEVVQKFGIRSMPTFVLLHNKLVINQFSGANEETLKNSLILFKQEEVLEHKKLDDFKEKEVHEHKKT